MVNDGRTTSPRPERGRRSGAKLGWPAWCITALVLGTSYSLRLRSADRSVEGDVDFQIILEMLLYGAVGAFLVTRLRFLPGGRPRLLAVIVWLYSSTVVLSVLYSPIPGFALVRIGQLGVGLVLITAVERSATRAQLHGALHVFVLLVAVSSAVGAVVPFSYPGQLGRYTWWNMHPNAAGMLLAIAAIIMVSYSFDSRNRDVLVCQLWVYRGVLGLIVVALVATQSRTSIAGAAAGVVIVAMYTVRRRLDAAALAAVVLAIAALVGWSTAETYLLRGQDAEEFGSLSTRTDVWDFALESIHESPVLGHGYGASRELFSYRFRDLGGAHNAYLELTIDAGIVGGALLVMVAVLTAHSAWSAARRTFGDLGAEPAMLLGVMTFLILQSLTEQGLGQPATIHTLWLFIVIGWLLKLRRSVAGPGGGALRSGQASATSSNVDTSALA